MIPIDHAQFFYKFQDKAEQKIRKGPMAASHFIGLPNEKEAGCCISNRPFVESQGCSKRLSNEIIEYIAIFWRE